LIPPGSAAPLFVVYRLLHWCAFMRAKASSSESGTISRACQFTHPFCVSSG